MERICFGCLRASLSASKAELSSTIQTTRAFASATNGEAGFGLEGVDPRHRSSVNRRRVRKFSENVGKGDVKPEGFRNHPNQKRPEWSRVRERPDRDYRGPSSSFRKPERVIQQRNPNVGQYTHETSQEGPSSSSRKPERAIQQRNPNAGQDPRKTSRKRPPQTRPQQVNRDQSQNRNNTKGQLQVSDSVVPSSPRPSSPKSYSPKSSSPRSYSPKSSLPKSSSPKPSPPKPSSPEASPPKRKYIRFVPFRDMVQPLPPSWIHPEFPNQEWLSAWTILGVPEMIACRLLIAYPHIKAPTPAQRAFLLSVFAGKDVYLKDDMGRGKTLAIAVAAITLAYRNRSWGRSGETGKVQVKEQHIMLILLPNTHLLHQVERDMLILDPTFAHPLYPEAPGQKGKRLFAILDSLDKPGKKVSDPIVTATPPVDTYERKRGAAVLLARPKDFEMQGDNILTTGVKTIIVDEPDTMLPRLPSRHEKNLELAKHQVNRHPPPLVQVMYRVLGIRDTQHLEDFEPGRTDSDLRRPSKGRIESLFLDFSRRHDIQTVWTSGTLSHALRRFNKLRGWVRGKEDLVDLDFTAEASPRLVAIREQALQMDRILPEHSSASQDVTATSISGVEPEHYALVVDPFNGHIESLDPTSGASVGSSVEPEKGTIPQTILDTLGLVHSASPPPPGTYALAICPEGTSLDTLQNHLQYVGIASIHLRPEILQDVSILDPDKDDNAPILLARRSVVAGLHLPRLHTVYMIEGLGVNVEKTGTKEFLDLITFYRVAAGRLGRLGTNGETEQSPKQRIISIVNQGSPNERILNHMFFGRFSGTQPLKIRETDDEYLPKRWKLSHWDTAELRKTIQELMKAE